MKKDSWAERSGWRGWADVPLLLFMLLCLAAWCALMFVSARRRSGSTSSRGLYAVAERD